MKNNLEVLKKIRDSVSADDLKEGTGIKIQKDDTTGEITISSTGSGGGSSIEQSYINGNIIVDSEEIKVYDDTEIKERISPLEALKFRTMVGEELDYALLTVVEDSNFIPEAYTVIPFCVVVSASGIDVNKEKYSVRLKSGKTYSLQAYIRVGQVARWEYFHFYDLTHSTPIGFDGCSEHNGSAWATSATANAIFTPTEDCDVCVMFADVDSNNTKCLLQSGTTFMKIEEIGRTYIHDPVKSVNDKDGIEDTPVGHIISFMGKTAPKHYLICDGKIYNISDYPKLAEFIEKEFGACNYFGGDGVTTFAVPDLRGEFLRGYDPTNIRDPQGSTRGIGKHQDATKLPQYGINNTKNSIYATKNTEANLGISNKDSEILQGSVDVLDCIGISRATTITTNTFTTRPTNINVLYCIKYEPTYYMEYHPKYGYMKQDVLFEGEAKEGEHKLLQNISNYDYILIEFSANHSSYGTGVYKSCEFLKVEDIKFLDARQFLKTLYSENYCSYSFTDGETLKIYEYSISGSSWKSVYISKITGVKCTEKTLGLGVSSEDQNLTDEEINTLITNSFIKEGE